MVDILGLRDGELVTAFLGAAGNLRDDLYIEIARRTRPAIVHTIKKYTYSYSEDLMQECHRRLLRDLSRGKYNCKKAGLAAYSHVICRNACIDDYVYRSGKKRTAKITSINTSYDDDEQGYNAIAYSLSTPPEINSVIKKEDLLHQMGKIRVLLSPIETIVFDLILVHLVNGFGRDTVETIRLAAIKKGYALNFKQVDNAITRIRTKALERTHYSRDGVLHITRDIPPDRQTRTIELIKLR